MEDADEVYDGSGQPVPAVVSDFPERLIWGDEIWGVTTKRVFVERRGFHLYNVEHTKTGHYRFYYLTLQTLSKGWFNPVHYVSVSHADYEWVKLASGEEYKYWRRETVEIACPHGACAALEAGLKKARQLHQAHRRSEIASYRDMKAEETRRWRDKAQSALSDEIRNLPRLPEGS